MDWFLIVLFGYIAVLVVGTILRVVGTILGIEVDPQDEEEKEEMMKRMASTKPNRLLY